jgi:hypothetical protein
MAKKRPNIRNRSAISGRFVKKSYAKQHPKTTVNHAGGRFSYGNIFTILNISTSDISAAKRATEDVNDS